MTETTILPARGLNIAGRLLTGAGVGIAGTSLFMTTTATETIPGAPEFGIAATTSTVHNIGLLQAQMAYLHIGLVAALAGIICLCAVAIVRQISSVRP